MTRTRIAIFLSITLFIIYFVYSSNPKAPEISAPSLSTKSSAPKVDTENLEIDGKKVLGLSPGKEKEQLENLQLANTPSEAWKPHLEETLKLQAGDSIKEMTIEKVASFVWVQHGIALHAESVIVKLKGTNKEQTSFRLLVDAQSGQILQNWDQPIYDPLMPKNEFKLKAEPAEE